MNYKHIPLKLDQFISYINSGKINLIPPFQRGHVWKLAHRRKLIANVVKGKPIPAIFLYTETSESGEQYSYNILDGKQRLESLMLFVGNEKDSLKVAEIGKYFFDERTCNLVNFKVKIDGNTPQGLKDLDPTLFRDFQEYLIPTIEITLDEENPAALPDMIDLFVDINSYGEKVKRFDIVKAMLSGDDLLESAFKQIAQKENRGKDVLYKAKKNEFTRVLKALQIVDGLRDANAKVDRMWELFVEVILFTRTKKHRTPIDILRTFIKSKKTGEQRIAKNELKGIRELFRFLEFCYRDAQIRASKMAKNQIHFYTMTTAIISDNLMNKYGESDLKRRIGAFADIIDERSTAPRNLKKVIESYNQASAKHTTHPGRRSERQVQFLAAIDAL